MKLLELDDVEILDLDFTCSVNVLGQTLEEELKPGGADCTVTNENLEEYLGLQCKYRVMNRIREQVGVCVGSFQLHAWAYLIAHEPCSSTLTSAMRLCLGLHHVFAVFVLLLVCVFIFTGEAPRAGLLRCGGRAPLGALRLRGARALAVRLSRDQRRRLDEAHRVRDHARPHKLLFGMK